MSDYIGLLPVLVLGTIAAALGFYFLHQEKKAAKAKQQRPDSPPPASKQGV